MYKEILISIDDIENRAAVLEDGRLMEIYISREDRQTGSIYKGKVANILPGMQAAFVDIGLERNAFLCMDDASALLGEDLPSDFKQMSIKDVLKVNQEPLVQIMKEAWGLKGARVTTHITLPGRYLVLLPSAQYIGVSRKLESDAERERLRKIAESIKTSSYGVIVRTAAEGHSEAELKRDLDFLIKVWDKIVSGSKRKKAPLLVHQELNLVYKIIRDMLNSDTNKVIVDSKSDYTKIMDLVSNISPEFKDRITYFNEKKNLFDQYGIEAEIEKALRRKVWLDSGGFLIIEKTEALTVIDVNTGRYVGKNSLSDTILKTNLEAVPEIARQLRLRDIGGIIIVDFIDMDSDEDRLKVLDELQLQLKRDHTKTHLVGMTELGLVQITRKRAGKDLDEYLRSPCPYCSGKGRVYSLTSMRLKCEREIRRAAEETQFNAISVEVHPKLAVELLGLAGEDLERLEKIAGKQIVLKANVDLHLEKINIDGIPDKTIKQLKTKLQTGNSLTLDVLDVYGVNMNDGIAVHDKNLIAIQSAGNRVGEKISVIVTEINEHYISAVIKE